MLTIDRLNNAVDSVNEVMKLLKDKDPELVNEILENAVDI